MDGATGSRRRNESSASAFKPPAARAGSGGGAQKIFLPTPCPLTGRRPLRLKIRMSRAHINILGLTKIET